VRGCGIEIGVTQATKNAQVVVRGLGAVQAVVWCVKVDGMGGADV
jgi:hypothetical protein